MKHSFCEDWEFTHHWTEAFGKGLPVPKQQAVRLPHTCREVPLHYASPADYEMVCGYRKRFRVPPVQAAPRLFLRFDGAAHQAVVRVNGRVAGQHRGGYTGFAVEITDLVDREGENLLTVQLDTREDPAIPPFGFVIDYLTYGGLYREVWLEATAESRLTDLFVYTPTLHDAVVQWTAELTPAAVAVRIRLETADGTLLAEQTAQAAETGKMQFSVPDAQPWDTEHPVLHHATAELLNAAGQPIDRKQVTFGFRTAEFRADGFYLNGKKTFLRGLNRHQSYPYIGYAAPESLQREDARILQEELHCTAVRTSHYPQSPYFLDECDRRGLLVFTELPGWQHIGDDNWKDAACEMLREMLLQNRSHPSIILWGVRINESVDDDAFYTRTNQIAHQLDPSRATSGVRYLEKSHLLEDVYAYNDFSHNGVTPGAKPKKDVTPDMGKALLISECNGHMYPTKPFDDGPHRQEHALRHVRVQNAAYASGEHAGCFGWCMFDYQTHKDFGSGDRICYHGVLDSFRNPKLAAAVYASQGDADPVLAVSSSMDIGDNPAGQLGTAYVFSNAQQVKLYKNDVFVTALRQSEWTALPHPPFVMDDTIGELLETQEHFSPAKAAAVRDCLLAARKIRLGGTAAGLQGQIRLVYAALQNELCRWRGPLRQICGQLGRRGYPLAVRCCTGWQRGAQRDPLPQCKAALGSQGQPDGSSGKRYLRYGGCPGAHSGRAWHPCPLRTVPGAVCGGGQRRPCGPADRRCRGRHDRNLSAHRGHCRRSPADRFCTADPARCAAVYH